MATKRQYLDAAGVNQLWTAVKSRTDEKVSDVVYQDQMIYILGAEWNEGDSETHLLYKGKERKIISSFSASDFIKDGMISEVNIITPKIIDTDITYKDKTYHKGIAVEQDTEFIQFKWNYDKNTDGSINNSDSTFIKLDELGATYKADGVSIEKASDNTFSVKEVKTKQTTTNADITIEGGPLADFAKQVYAGGVLPAGTNMQDFLMNMLCVEKWPNGYTYQEASLTSSVAKPTIEMCNDTVEVGASVPYTVKNGASSATAKNFKVSGLTYGYSETDTLTKPELTGYHAETLKESTHTEVIASTPETTLTLSGFSKETMAGTNKEASATITGTRVATEGLNTLGASNTSSIYTATFNELPVVYGVSNLKNTKNIKENSKTYPTVIRNQKEITSSQVTATASEKSFTGAYYAFVGFTETVPTTSKEIRAFIGNGYTKLGKGNVKDGKCNKAYMTVALPNGWDFDLLNSFNASIRPTFEKDKKAPIDIVLPNGVTKTYNVWCISYPNGDFKDFVIK